MTATDGALTTVEVVTVPVTPPHHVVIATIPVDSPTGGAVSPDGAHFFVANPGSDTISVINTATNTVVATSSAAITATRWRSTATPRGTSSTPTTTP